MQENKCNKLPYEAASCQNCPLRAFEHRQMFSTEEHNLRNTYLYGFSTPDGKIEGRTTPDPESPAYLYDFAASAELSGLSLEPDEASITGTPDNKFILAMMACLITRYEH